MHRQRHDDDDRNEGAPSADRSTTAGGRSAPSTKEFVDDGELESSAVVGVEVPDGLWDDAVPMSDADVERYLGPTAAAAFRGKPVRVVEATAALMLDAEYPPVLATQHGILVLADTQDPTSQTAAAFSYHSPATCLAGHVAWYVRRLLDMSLSHASSQAAPATSTSTSASSMASTNSFVVRQTDNSQPLSTTAHAAAPSLRGPEADVALINTWAHAATPPAPLAAYDVYGPGTGRSMSESARELAKTFRQGSQQWLNVRQAFATASEIGRLVGLDFEDWRLSGQPDALQRSPIYAALTGYAREQRHEVQSTPSMQYGNDNESVVGTVYSILTGNQIATSGMVICGLPEEGYIAASPDLLVNQDGVADVKVAAYKPRDSVAYNMPQMQTLMHVLDKPWCDVILAFLPYSVNNHPRHVYDTVSSADRSEIRVFRIQRSDSYWAKMHAALVNFIAVGKQAKAAIRAGGRIDEFLALLKPLGYDAMLREYGDLVADRQFWPNGAYKTAYQKDPRRLDEAIRAARQAVVPSSAGTPSSSSSRTRGGV
jgi:hypothetical protein